MVTRIARFVSNGLIAVLVASKVEAEHAQESSTQHR